MYWFPEYWLHPKIWSQFWLKDVLAVYFKSSNTHALLSFSMDWVPSMILESSLLICAFQIRGSNFALCNTDEAANIAGEWTVTGHRIEYCLDQPIKENCSLQFSLPIMWIVIFFNLVNDLVWFWLFWGKDRSLWWFQAMLSHHFSMSPVPLQKKSAWQTNTFSGKRTGNWGWWRGDPSFDG